MDSYSALLVDDEAHCIRTLEKQISWVDLPINIVGKVNSVREAISSLTSLDIKPTFIFLDIHMGDEDGFALLNQMDLSDSHVIFTTAYEQYALEAFKHRASGYLTKPLSVDELEALLKSIVGKKSSSKGPQVLKISTRGVQEVLSLATIVYIEADGSYTKVYLNDGSVKVVSKNLKSLAESLKETHFVRIHSKYLINVREIQKLVKGDKPYVQLKTVIELPISRSRKEEVYRVLEEL